MNTITIVERTGKRITKVVQNADEFIKDSSSMAYDNSGISMPENSLTEDEKQAAWLEFEAEQRSLDYENNFQNI